MKDIREALALIEAELQKGISPQACTSVERKVIQRTFRIFKMQLTPAFFARLEECLPELPPAELSARAALVARQESLQAQKRMLLVKWRLVREELQQARQQEAAERKKKVAADWSAMSTPRRWAMQAHRRQQAQEWRQRNTEEAELKEAMRMSAELEQQELKEQRRLKRQAWLQDGVQTYRAQKEQEGWRRLEEARIAASTPKRKVSAEVKRRQQGRSVERLRRNMEACRRVREERSPSPGPKSGKLSRSASYSNVESRVHDNTISSACKITLRGRMRQLQQEAQQQAPEQQRGGQSPASQAEQRATISTATPMGSSGAQSPATAADSASFALYAEGTPTGGASAAAAAAEAAADAAMRPEETTPTTKVRGQLNFDAAANSPGATREEGFASRTKAAEARQLAREIALDADTPERTTPLVQ